MLEARIPMLLQAAPPRDSLAVAADVASIVIAAAVLVVVALTGLLFLRIYRVLGEIRLGVRQNLGPVSDRARSISDNVEFITEVLRSDVESLNASVRALADRLTLASERMEERIEEFNALMEVVQGEAEDIFVDTAATVRGVRESARSITAARARAAPGPSHRAPPPAETPSEATTDAESEPPRAGPREANEGDEASHAER